MTAMTLPTFRENLFFLIRVNKLTATLVFLRHIAMALDLRSHVSAVREEEVDELERETRRKEAQFMGNFLGPTPVANKMESDAERTDGDKAKVQRCT